MRLLRPVMGVRPPKQGHVLVLETHVQKQCSKVFLRRDGLGEHHSLSAAASIATEIEDDADRVLKGARLRVVGKGSSTPDEVLDERQFTSDCTAVDRHRCLVGYLLDLFFVF